jgi:HAE1 family hydrophobic/amphiphilic exporter-1
MKGIVKWCVNNSPAMNVCMLAILALGAWSLTQLRREFFPYTALDEIEVEVEYRGASPEEVEEGICQRIEEAVRSVEGVRRITSRAREGNGLVTLELQAAVSEADVQMILGEIRSRVDQIPSLPALAEEPQIRRREPRTTALNVGVLGPDDETIDGRLALRDVAETVRDELLLLDSISQAEVLGVPRYQIDIEISEHTLRQHNLTLQQVADIVRRENVEIPSGTLKTESQEILLRGSNRQNLGEEIAHVPLLTQPNGVVLTVADLATIHDAFTDDSAISRINGRPGLPIDVSTTQTEDILAVQKDVYEYVRNREMPDGYELIFFRDRTDDVEARLALLSKNGWQGLILVFLMLALFLELRLAMWVALGIPISIGGACFVMLYTGQTLNMVSMFAFLMTLGIVVDDAIVIGENVYVHRKMGKTTMQAAIDGTVEVMPSVVTSVLTTMIAFLPMLFMTGTLARFTTVLPMAVIAILMFSLAEALTILPSHLAHDKSFFTSSLAWLLNPLKPLSWLLGIANRACCGALDWVQRTFYMPLLKWSLKYPVMVLSIAASLLIVTVGVVRSGIVPYIILPRLDSTFCTVVMAFPDGTPESVTDAATKQLEDAFNRLNQQCIDEKLTDNPKGIATHTHRAVGYGASTYGAVSSGSHVGSMTVSLIDTGDRRITSQEIVARWRKEAGRFEGVDYLSFGAGPRSIAAAPIEFSLLARNEDTDQLEEAINKCVARLEQYPGVFDISAGGRPGKWEYRLKIKDEARTMGISLAELSSTVRASYYGEEVMRLQRGRHEVELRVRYPREERTSFASFDELRVRGDDGAERPLTELAQVDLGRSFSTINRLDQMRSITISTDVDEDVGNAFEITSDFKANFMTEIQQEYPRLRVLWEGQQEQTNESMNSMYYGFIAVIGAMFLLLTIEFKSYVQPLLILAIIPFGAVGAIGGHIIQGLPFTLFSIYGLVALSGVVVNDSIVLIDFINSRYRSGLPLKDAILEAGERRFRPVVLTSITTIGGMLPILMETNRQALVLIPMATSLAFGLMLATAIVLVLAPTLYYVTTVFSDRSVELPVGESA